MQHLRRVRELSFQEANAWWWTGSPFEVIDVERARRHESDCSRTHRLTLRQLFENGARIDETFSSCDEDEDWTFAEVMEESDRPSVTRSFTNYGVNRSATAGASAIQPCANYPEWIISFAAILSIGAISVSMNAWWTGQELEYAITTHTVVSSATPERIERGTDACQRANVRMLGVRLDKLAPLAPTLNTGTTWSYAGSRCRSRTQRGHGAHDASTTR